MGWSAVTNYMKIGKGTVFALMFSPHVDGHKPPKIKAGDVIGLEFADNSRGQAIVLEASDESITIQTEVGNVVMTPHGSGDNPIGGGVDTGSIPSTDWVVRGTA